MLRCGEEPGWAYNSLTQRCVKYFNSQEAAYSYSGAESHCNSMGGQLYSADTKEAKFLLYRLMKRREYRYIIIYVVITDPVI